MHSPASGKWNRNSFDEKNSAAIDSNPRWWCCSCDHAIGKKQSRSRKNLGRKPEPLLATEEPVIFCVGRIPMRKISGGQMVYSQNNSSWWFEGLLWNQFQYKSMIKGNLQLISGMSDVETTRSNPWLKNPLKSAKLISSVYRIDNALKSGKQMGSVGGCDRCSQKTVKDCPRQEKVKIMLGDTT